MPAPRTALAIALAVMACASVACGDSKADKPAGTVTRTGSEAATANEALIAGQVAEAQRAVRAAPKDPDALENLVRQHVRLAFVRGNVTGDTIGPAGEAELRKAAVVWERYLALGPRRPDAQLATLMTRAFGASGLDEPRKAIRAMRIAAEQTKPPDASVYAQLAVLYYGQQQLRQGDLAARRAAQLTPLNQRSNLRRSLRQIRSQAKTPGP